MKPQAKEMYIMIQNAKDILLDGIDLFFCSKLRIQKINEIFMIDMVYCEVWYTAQSCRCGVSFEEF
jgi:hypothetical protein